MGFLTESLYSPICVRAAFFCWPAEITSSSSSNSSSNIANTAVVANVGAIAIVVIVIVLVVVVVVVVAGYAKTQRPKELLPGRTNLSADWLDTACKAVRPPNAPFQVRRGCSGRNVLWLVDDLVAHFKS